MIGQNYFELLRILSHTIFVPEVSRRTNQPGSSGDFEAEFEFIGEDSEKEIIYLHFVKIIDMQEMAKKKCAVCLGYYHNFCGTCRIENELKMKKEAFVEIYSKDSRICNDEAVLSLQKTIMIKEIISGVSVDNEEKNYEATQSARKMLESAQIPTIDYVINVSFTSFLLRWRRSRKVYMV